MIAPWLVAVLVLLSIVATAALGFSIWAFRVLKRVTKVKGAEQLAFEAETTEILRRLDERVRPLPKPTISPDEVEKKLAEIAAEAYRAAEQMAEQNKKNGNKVTSADKQREAIRYVKQRVAELHVDTDMAVMAKRIESVVQEQRSTREIK